jgi:hypothetical protein
MTEEYYHSSTDDNFEDPSLREGDDPNISDPPAVSGWSGEKKNPKTSWATAQFEKVNDDAYVSWETKIQEAFKDKRAKSITDAMNLRPGVNATEKTVLLPDTIDKEDNLLVKAMGVLSQKLGYSVKLLPYGTRKTRELTRETEKISQGISFVIIDFERKFNIDSKKDPYEYGRTFARAQQIVGAVSSNAKLGVDVLKKSQRFFGNNPNEMEGEKRMRIHVQYLARNTHQFFIEEEWEKDLSLLLNALLRKSSSLVKEEVMTDSIKDNMLSYSEAVALYMTRSVVVSPASGRRPAVTAERIPKKPKENSLITKSEMSVIDTLIKDLYSAPYDASKDAWYTAIKKDGWPSIKRELVRISTERANFLSKFAALTTKRLNEVRLSGVNKSKRKKDISPNELISCLALRDIPKSKFGNEIISLDPQFKGILSSFRVYKEGSDTEWSFTSSQQAIHDFIISKIDYSAVEEAKKDIPEWQFNPLFEVPKSGKGGLNPLVPPYTPLPKSIERETRERVEEFCNSKRVPKVAREVMTKMWKDGNLLGLQQVDSLADMLLIEAELPENKNLKADLLKEKLRGVCNTWRSEVKPTFGSSGL